MREEALELLDVIYQIHRQRFRAEKIFNTLPEEVRKKHGFTLEDVQRTSHEAGHELADVVLEIM